MPHIKLLSGVDIIHIDTATSTIHFIVHVKELPKEMEDAGKDEELSTKVNAASKYLVEEGFIKHGKWTRRIGIVKL